MRYSHDQEIRYYQSYTDDFVMSRKQSHELPENYVWLHKSLIYRCIARGFQFVAAIISFFYCRLYLNVKIVNQYVLKECGKSGFFLYGNHTQPVGDVFIPFRVLFPRCCYVIASPANLGIPVLGPMLPLFGALPTSESASDLKKLKDAVCKRIRDRSCVVIYPEAHVWPWYTGIRPYAAVSFGFPVMNNVPAYSMTTTYQKRRFGKKPDITIYIDGPFYPDVSLPQKVQKEKLRNAVYECMVQRSKYSTYQYIQYEKFN